MRFTLILLLLLVACVPQPMPAPSAIQEISGVVQGEMRLAGEVLLVGDLLVPQGSRLIIAAGTTIKVQASEATKIDPEFLSSQIEILVRGSLRVEGTATQPVTFAPAEITVDDIPQWAGILLDGASDSALQHLRISAAETGLLLIATDAQITAAHIEGCRYGIVVQGGAPTIAQSTLVAGEGGLFLWNSARPTLTDLLILDNAEEGLFIDRSSSPVLGPCRLERNAIGLVAANTVAIDSLILISNGEDLRRLSDRNGVQP